MLVNKGSKIKENIKLISHRINPENKPITYTEPLLILSNNVNFLLIACLYFSKFSSSILPEGSIKSTKAKYKIH